MFEQQHFKVPTDAIMLPKEHGRMAAGRGWSILDCPYEDKYNIEQWQEGWRSRTRNVKRHKNNA